MNDTMRKYVVIAELVGGQHDGRRMITEWNDITQTIYVPIVSDIRLAERNDDGDIEVGVNVLEYRIGTQWCVYNIANHPRALQQVLGEMRDTLYNNRWQVTKYYLEKEGI